jgi:hypothetical protein
MLIINNNLGYIVEMYNLMIFFSFVNCYSTKILIDLSYNSFKYSEPEKTTGPSGVVALHVVGFYYILFSFYY